MTSNIISSIKSIGFIPKNGEIGIYHKLFDDYEIQIILNEENFAKSIIDYGSKIKIHRQTTNDFMQAENLVVLECVNRLLEKGYRPSNLELEKTWNLGHSGKGYLDIWVKDEKGKSFLMIECKTWAKEYDKAKRVTLNEKKKHGGQIFSYLQQEPTDTKAICYYTSNIEKNKITYKNAIIYNKEDWKGLSQEERYPRWNETYEANGIFEEWVSLYNLESKALLRKDLKQLDKNDSGIIYNKFAEILRHNVISDKPNAFNKIINLFLCKVFDEDRLENDELKFQIRTNTREKTNEELLEDLNDLYKRGMEAYLQKEVPDYTKEEFNDMLLGTTEHNKGALEKLYKTLRLYKNNEFAFREVFDKKSFEENAVVVREVVELLQDKQLRYTHKQQFLGDFFEKLLNDSIKQEAGQFFTPVPLAQFIIKSLPLKEFINNKIQNESMDILPYVIDYACGAGHFLTEMMDEIQKIIREDIKFEDIKKPALKDKFKTWANTNFEWADKYIYGMDLDYRLIKTSKISCFLNGDGLANLIHANGLSDFDCEEYYGLLKNSNKSKDNQKFDILIANPPYSVKFFKNTLPKGSQCFDLYNGLTENSSEIECLFIERAKQLIKEDGLVGIILPVSFLTNGSLYIKAREIVLKYFDIKGVLSLDNNAFMATGTKTIVLFMKRRSNNFWQNINHLVNSFMSDYRDVTVDNTEKAFSKYVENNFEDLSFNDYKSILKNNPTENAKNSEIYKDYSKLNNKQIRSLEQQKILYFMLSYNSRVVVANSGAKDIEKEFLGYEFSNRKNREGININKDNDDNIISKLYNDVELDETKVNYYIYNNFVDIDISNSINRITEQKNHPLNNHIDYARLSELLDFSLPIFDKKIDVNFKKKIKIESKYPSLRIDDLKSYFSSGVVYSKKDVSLVETNKVILTASNVTIDNELDISKIIYLNNKIDIDANKKLKKDDILICLSSGSLSHIGKVAYIYDDSGIHYAGGFMGILRTNKKVLSKYMFYILESKACKNYMEAIATGNNINNLSSVFTRVKVPIPPVDVQSKIIKDIEFIEKQIDTYKDRINDIDNIMKEIIKVSCSGKKISDFVTLLKRGKSPKYGNSDIEIIKSGQVRGLYNFDFSKQYFANHSMGVDERLLEDGDLLINSTGVGTAGRVGIYSLKGKHFVDSHITIARLDKDIVLPVYVLYQLYFNIGFDNIEKLAEGQSGQVELSNKIIGNIKIPIPSLKEQEKIVEKILPLEKERKDLAELIAELPIQKQKILDFYLL